ncbi:Uncharacterised protein [Actinobacillus pleuropneumoniae]|nr:Uncharacterised protein [Actinobacillus pleuropneumoniae]
MRGAKEAIRVWVTRFKIWRYSRNGNVRHPYSGQQGPQILSLFGPLGAIAGAAYRVPRLCITWEKQKTQDSWMLLMNSKEIARIFEFFGLMDGKTERRND